MDDIRSLRRRTELLAPAGRWDTLEAVIDAGADAVYLSGKRFQMRAHRRDFHFDEETLRDAIHYAHKHNRRVYVTVNSLLAEHELDDAKDFLGFLSEAGADGIIVFDLATVAMAREIGADYEVHASTMMNVHDADQARFLKDMGIHRVVTSRDISIGEAAQIGEASGLAIEYFLHGDMCVAQSGQCALSGVAFGKSSNRGECMKPCRWQYSLLRAGGNEEPLQQGHLMAIRDLSLIRHIPELVEAGICALKIEGRMRDAAYLKELVTIYREVLDLYYAFPAGFSPSQDTLERLFHLRVRELSALTATGAPSNATFFDISGKREPLILSNGVVEADMPHPAFQFPDFDAPEITSRFCPELTVSVASPQAAEAALEAGADRIYLASETAQYGYQQWNVSTFTRAMAIVAEHKAALGLRSPRVSTKRIRAEWAIMAELCQKQKPQYLLAHHFGDIRRAQRFFPEASMIADYGFNTLNSGAARVLLEWGVSQITPSQEAGYKDVAQLACDRSIPLELVVHGPITGMLLDHCLIAMHLNKGASKEVCRGVCRHVQFSLRDNKGELRSIVTDQYCRNHLLTAKDVALLPILDPFLHLEAVSMRIEGQFYSPELVGMLTAAYRRALDAWKRGEEPVAPAREEWTALCSASPRPWNLGAYAQNMTHSDSTLEVMRSAR